MNFYPDGLGESPLTGDALLKGEIYTHGDVWYVSSATGFDAPQPASNKQQPFATLAFAITQITAGDVIVLMQDHDEFLTAPVAIPEGTTVIGAGNTGGVPDAKLTVTGVNGVVTTGGPYTQVRNVHFCASTATPVNGYYLLVGPDMHLRGCQFDCGMLDTTTALMFDDDPTWASYFWDCKFLVVSGGAILQPPRGMYLPVATNERYLQMRDVVFDGGTNGFGIAGIDLTGDAQNFCINFHAWNISLLNGADALVNAFSRGYIHVIASTGGSRVVW